MFVWCECYVLSGRGLCDGFITRPEESYRLWRVVVCDQETSKTKRLPLPGCENTTTVGCNVVTNKLLLLLFSFYFVLVKN
jgi:hypothetical protein